MFFRVKPAKGYRYLQIAHSVRRGKTVRQEIIAALGRLNVLQASGQLESLMRGGLRYCEKIKVMDAHAAGQTEPVSMQDFSPLRLPQASLAEVPSPLLSGKQLRQSRKM